MEDIADTRWRRPSISLAWTSMMKTVASRKSILIVACCLIWAGCREASDPGVLGHEDTFTNPVYEGADPFIYKHSDGSYYFCQSEGDRGIAVWKSDRLTDKGFKRVVWTPPDVGWNTSEIWAPELHYLDGKWYIYYAADSGENKDHRMGVLESVSDDPQGRYVDKGMLYTGDEIETGTNNRWAIDGTPLEMNGRLYFVWSGWEGAVDEQWLYIAEMENPWTIATNRVRLAENDEYVWERVSESLNERGLNEAPQILRHGDKVFIIYSVSGSWQPTYKLAQLSIPAHADPMVRSNWTKGDRPVFTGSDRVHGVGHASFTKSPDGSEDWIVYHTKVDTIPGWHRVVHIQPFTRTEAGPNFGDPVPAGVPLALPAGESPNSPGRQFSDDFAEGHWDNWVYYGYNRFIGTQDSALSIRSAPGRHMPNNFSTGEKALIRGYDWSEFTFSSRVRMMDDGGEAGLLFRATHPSVGYHAVKGYFAGLRPSEDVLVLGTMNGTAWSELARTELPIENGEWYEVTVAASGSEIDVRVNGASMLRVEDGMYARGMAGVRVADTHALFDAIEIHASSSL